MATLSLTVRRQSWPIQGSFKISRDAITEVETLIVELAGGGQVGRGECRPYKRYGETLDSVQAQIESQRKAIEGGMDRDGLAQALPAGAARNALDCALWDLEAKTSGKPAWRLMGLEKPGPVLTAYTVSLDTPTAMAEAAHAAAERPLIKVKLGGGDGQDGQRIRAVRHGAPKARLIVDANEGWPAEETPALMAIMADAGVEMVEQPLPAGRDQILAEIDSSVVLCADESCHDRSSLPMLGAAYDMVNVKLDKTGGVTEALALMDQARAAGYQVMMGCMLASSLATAPAALIGTRADLVDLDGPLLLAQDWDPPLTAEGSYLNPPEPALWG